MNTGLKLLELPDGFRYVSIGWTGDPMTSGAPTPRNHDGMAAFKTKGDLIALVRNHEVPGAQPNGPKTPAFGSNPYDPEAGGGTTTMLFDPKAEKLVSITPSLSGTLVNCAGGPTPWGAWLSCEETLLDPKRAPTTTRPHGYIFEVPHDGVSDAKPLVAMGRFWHEAIAVDPDTGIVYETEDRTGAGLYRFIPKKTGQLAEGGTLQALAIKGKPQFDTRLGQGPRDVQYDIDWVDIPEPDRAHVDEGRGTRAASSSRDSIAAPPSSRDSRARGSATTACSSPRRMAATRRWVRCGNTIRNAAACDWCSNHPARTCSRARTTSPSAPAAASRSAKTAPPSNASTA